MDNGTLAVRLDAGDRGGGSRATLGGSGGGHLGFFFLGKSLPRMRDGSDTNKCSPPEGCLGMPEHHGAQPMNHLLHELEHEQYEIAFPPIGVRAEMLREAAPI